ncbi:uncharacterized protein LOC132327950 isoform X3 [Haemorhous mexicanus]|uniref:uncharacterized protein LOC132327950 isoform X3 n=1 Tax=Haemorhous mexicanus TaxID=30427 RepID=UPI0028BE7C7E|nr:uncharacterized protein LOC132327950 isoform X3 [Haemorhous mexicanus]
MAKAQEQPPALSDIQVLVLTGVTLPAALLSLLGSGSVLAVTSWQGRCCHIQLRPLFLLALADFLGATALLGTGTIPLLPAPLSAPAYAACPYGRMLTTTSYAVSFLMVVVYAYESHRTVLGGRARPPAALQERSRCLESAWRGIPYVLAWLVPALTLLAQLLARGTSAADIAPAVPWAGSNDTFSLYCSSSALSLQLSPPDPSEPGHLLPVRRGQKRGAGGENHLPAVPAAGARLLLAPVPAGAAPLPGERGAAAARPGPGRRLRGQERPQRPQSLAVFPAGFPALLDASLPPHRPLLHQHQPCLALCALRVRSPECVPAGLPAQSGLRLDEGELPTGGAGPEPLPAEPRRGQGFLRRLPGGCFLSSHLIPFPGGCSHLIPFPGGCFLSSHLIPFPGGCSLDSHLIPLPGGCFLSSHLIPFPGGCSHLIPFPGGCSHLIPFPGGCSHLIPFPGGCSHLIPFPGGCSLGSHLIPFPGGCSHLIPFPGGCSHLIPFLGGCSLGSHLIPFPGCSPKPRQDLHIPSSSGNPGMAGWEGTSEPLQCHLPRLPVSWQGPLDAAPRAWSGLGRAQVGLGRSHSTGGTCGPSLLETSHLPQTHRDGAQNPGTTEAGVALEGLRGLFPPKPFRLWDIGLAGDGVWPPWEECKAKSISLRENS